jgi:hypothetical protein
MFRVGGIVSFHYPTKTNCHEIDRSPVRLRRVEVVEVRDLVRQPITIIEFLERPLLCRSRYLIDGIDLENGERRQFYAGSSVEFRSSGLLRIGLYMHGRQRPTEVVSRGFEPTVADRRKMVERCLEWADTIADDASLAVFADDLRPLVVPAHSVISYA